MSNLAENEPKKFTKNHANASYKVFRQDYMKHSALSYREAAEYSMLTIGRLQWLVCQGYIKRVAIRGPFRVDKASLEAYLRGDVKTRPSARKPRLAKKEA